MFSLCLDLQVRHVQCTDTMHAYLGSPRHSWALTCAADFEAEEEGKPDMEDAVQQLISILDPDTSTLEARQLLFRANGDIARALNLHYDDASNSGEMLPAEWIAKLYNDLLSCMFCPGAPERSLSCSLRMYDLIICTRVC